MKRRVVVTGLGVVAPNGIGVAAFEEALRSARSGIRYVPKMKEVGLGCTVAGIPQGVDEAAARRFRQEELLAMNSTLRYGSLAALEAWEDAGLERPEPNGDRVNWGTGAVIGTGIGGMDTVGETLVPLTDSGKSRRLGSTTVEKVMASGVSACVSGLLALGNQVTTNSSACATGTEAIVLGAQRIRAGLAERMLCGGSEGASHYTFAAFDAMRVLCRAFNDAPERASRPMSASARGFVPACGAGVLVLEELDSALARGARIYAEVLGGAVSCGGHRGGGSMTAPNPKGIRRCIRAALADAAIAADEVDAISGHLTATGADPGEVEAWASALERGPGRLPWITSTKSMIGHALGAAGAVESVAAVLMLSGGFIHASVNCEDLHPEIVPYAAAVPHGLCNVPALRTLIKAGFGFGDVNACVVFHAWDALAASRYSKTETRYEGRL
ncbi:MAG TPA: beta-ketoacyl-[acyl-carrier-protein] synthase family protein [Candidatus Binatia bacterium]|nr:beta-ketoacyl-[acyl-carrier-protein] synthase family protein [Candidatus Binatia bacterium]